MFDDLLDKLNAFVRERKWGNFHHPQSLAMGLTIEVAEILEHFINLENPESLKRSEDVIEEVGDVMCVYLLLVQAMKLDILEVLELPSFDSPLAMQTHIHSIEKTTCPKTAILILSYRAARLQESFLWLSEAESRNFFLLSKDIERLKNTFYAFANLSYLLNIDILRAAESKLLKNHQKFPIPEVHGKLIKHKDREFTQ